MKSNEIVLLQHCENDWTALKPLFENHVQATIYRTAKRLIQKGLLNKKGARYKTTAEGLKILASQKSEDLKDILQEAYPPLSLIPSSQHRALVELIFFAISVKMWQQVTDHLPSFAIFGETLRWKSSCALFICHALGLAPEQYLVDLSTESGRSIWLRKTATGDVVFKRSLLDAKFVVFDEYMLATSRVKTAVGYFISGRRTVPIENESIAIKPVALLTSNPKAEGNLERKTSFSAPQLRRLVILDTDKIQLPDLAITGNKAIDIARKHNPLVIAEPKFDCRQYRAAIVKTMRRILTASACSLVDFEMLLHLCSGATSFIPQPEDAIKHALHAYCTVVDTLGFLKENWFHAISAFTTTGNREENTEPEMTPEISTGQIINLYPLGKEKNHG